MTAITAALAADVDMCLVSWPSMDSSLWPMAIASALVGRTLVVWNAFNTSACI